MRAPSWSLRCARPTSRRPWKSSSCWPTAIASATVLAHRYPGLAADIAWAAPRLLARAQPTAAPHLQLDALLALALGDDALRAGAPFWLRAAAALVLPALAPLTDPTATIDDAIAVARELAPLFAPPPDANAGDAAFADLLPLLLDEYGGEPVSGDGPGHGERRRRR
jgi:hypothetical protein